MEKEWKINKKNKLSDLCRTILNSLVCVNGIPQGEEIEWSRKYLEKTAEKPSKNDYRHYPTDLEVQSSTVDQIQRKPDPGTSESYCFLPR